MSFEQLCDESISKACVQQTANTESCHTTWFLELQIVISGVANLFVALILENTWFISRILINTWQRVPA